MTRRTFAQVLKTGKIDLKKEYSKLYNLFYSRDHRDDKSLADLISLSFESFHFRGTCLDLDEFDEKYGFRFVEQPQNFNIDYLVSFCEYIYNFVLLLKDNYFFAQINRSFYLQHITELIEAIGYMQSSEDGFVIFVPKDSVAITVSELEAIPEKVSYKIISYNHYSMKGDLEAKKTILLTLANLLEPHERTLAQIDSSFKRDLFYAFNNFNIRHNNIDSSDKRNYKRVVAEMSMEEMEHWYDETYQMSLLAFMRLDQNIRKNEFETIKNRIETKDED